MTQETRLARKSDAAIHSFSDKKHRAPIFHAPVRIDYRFATRYSLLLLALRRPTS
jgi:hypothetical protein